MKNEKTCRIINCLDKPYSMGLCRQHYDQKKLKKERRESAIQTLHSRTIGESISTNEQIRIDLNLLCLWWDRACTVINSNNGTEIMPLEEAEFALSWCINMAQEIIDAELLIRSGKPIQSTYDFTKEWVWNRFSNLEKGLMSNGIERNRNNK